MKAWLVAPLALLGCGCVTMDAHRAKVQEMEAACADKEAAAGERYARADAARAKAEALRDQAQVERGALEARVKRLEAAEAAARAEVQRASSAAQAQGLEVARLKRADVENRQHADELKRALDSARWRLQELTQQREAAQAMAATFRGLVERLRGMIDAGRLSVTVRNGRMLIALPGDVLFDSGSVALKPEAQSALSEVAAVLADLPPRRFTVSGHTDTVPIRTDRFPSNWELSTARAVEVVRYLVRHGVAPERLAASGSSEFDPVASNDAGETRARNRRIEIVLEPNLGEMADVERALRGAP